MVCHRYKSHQLQNSLTLIVKQISCEVTLGHDPERSNVCTNSLFIMWCHFQLYSSRKSNIKDRVHVHFMAALYSWGYKWAYNVGITDNSF